MGNRYITHRHRDKKIMKPKFSSVLISPTGIGIKSWACPTIKSISRYHPQA